MYPLPLAPQTSVPEEPEAGDWIGRVTRHPRLAKARELLLDVPLFQKILIANTALVALGTVAGFWLTRHFVGRSEAWLLIAAGISSIGISVLLNTVILRAALSTIHPLVETVEQVRHGNATARVQRPFFGDPDMRRLGDTLNNLLDTVQLQRQELEAQLRRVQALSAKVIRAQEEERRRIALELHDEASQALTAIIVGHRVIEQLDDLATIKQRSAELRSLTADTLDGLHRLIVELRPSLLDDMGLLPALRYHLDEFAQRFGLQPQLVVEGLEERLPQEVETVLYRIVQEALTNVARHAQARRVHICLTGGAAQVRAVIEDDGRGFALERADRETVAKGVGLTGMQERAALVDGTCGVSSLPGRGTRVTVLIPLPGTGQAHAVQERNSLAQDPLVAR